jgi:hypothetical protein
MAAWLLVFVPEVELIFLPEVELSVFQLRRATMRLHYLVSIAAAVLIGFAAKLFFFPIPAEADISGLKSSASMDVFQMHRAGLPVQKMSDLTFVFSDD